jgi:hypothetical protein
MERYPQQRFSGAKEGATHATDVIPRATLNQVLDRISFPIESVRIRYSDGHDRQAMDAVSGLRKLEGAQDYSGDASLQTLVPLEGGGCVRVGITDDDVAKTPNTIWIDRYPGLAVQGAVNLQKTP